MDIKQQIEALEQSKEFHHQKYLNNLQIIDDKIERVEKQKEKKSFEYNIENIRKCCKNRSAATMFDALESVANALEIIRAEARQT